jgi:hypothetical protein
MRMVEPSHFVVSKQHTSWQFSHRGAVTGPFSDKAEAVAAALKEAKRLSAEGDPSEVIVENENRQFESTWRAEAAMPADLSRLASSE